MQPTSPRGIRRMIGRKQKQNKPVPNWMTDLLAEALASITQSVTCSPDENGKPELEQNPRGAEIRS